MSNRKYFGKIGAIYAGLWAFALTWLAFSGMIPNWIDKIAFPIFAASLLFYPAIAAGLICNRVTEMGRWLVGSAVGLVSAVVFTGLFYKFSPSGIDILGFCANGLVASALVTIGTVSTARFVGKYRYV